MRYARTVAAFVCAIAIASCGGSGSSPTSPTNPTPTPPARTTFNLSGSVVNNRANGIKIPNATLTITAGTNSGTATTSDASGNYQFTNLTPGTFTITSHAASYTDGSQAVTLGNADAAGVNIFMDPPVFVQSGIGDNVFTLPAWVSKVRVDATYGGYCQNFIVHVSSGAFSLINVIIGTCGVADSRSPFSGTYQVVGGSTVTITQSTGIAWTFTEQR